MKSPSKPYSRGAALASAGVCFALGVAVPAVATPLSFGDPMPAHRGDRPALMRDKVCGEVVVAAHRSRLAPDQLENSAEQMRATMRAGAFMLELDLRESRDGGLYVLHDDTLDRTTTGQGAIAERSDLDLLDVRLKSTSGPSSETLPRFEDVARWASAASDVRLMIDLKSASPEKVVALVDRYGLARRSVMLTFDDATAQAALAFAHDVVVSVLVRSKAEMDRYEAWPARRLAFYVPQDAAPTVFAQAKARGVLVISDALMPVEGGALDIRAERDGPDLYKAFLAQRPIDILVSDHAAKVCRALSH